MVGKFIFGTPSYIPPEALKGKGYCNKSDIYSVGSILFNILTHKHLFPGVSNESVLRENKNGDVAHVPYYLGNSIPGGCSEDLENFVMKLLTSDPDRRPRAKDALMH